MNCSNCQEPLKYHDYNYIGNHAAYEKGYEDSGFKVVSDVFICENEQCPEYRQVVTIQR